MKNNGDWELKDIPYLLKKFRDSGGHNPLPLLGARAALTDACGDLFDAAEKQSRGLTADERRSFDLYSAQVRQVNADLAKYKAARVAMDGADMVHLPF